MFWAASTPAARSQARLRRGAGSESEQRSPAQEDRAPPPIPRAWEGCLCAASLPRPSAEAADPPELVIAADVVGRIVELGREDEEAGVGRVLVLRAPHHRWEQDAEVRTVEHDLAPRAPVVGGDRAGA